MSIRPGPQSRHDNISEQERRAFRRLLADGAWTPDEAYRNMGKERVYNLIKEDYLAPSYTSMGW